MFEQSSLASITADWRVNRREYRALAALTLFRMTQRAMGSLERPRVASYVLIIAYRLFTEFLLGMELRPKTAVGPGLTIHHGYGLVVNDRAIIGAGVILRHGVTIGHKVPGGASPVIEDGVEIGAGAIVLGDIVVGRGAIIGAGSVVTTSVPPGAIVAGNPAVVIGNVGKGRAG